MGTYLAIAKRVMRRRPTDSEATSVYDLHVARSPAVGGAAGVPAEGGGDARQHTATAAVRAEESARPPSVPVGRSRTYGPTFGKRLCRLVPPGWPVDHWLERLDYLAGLSVHVNPRASAKRRQEAEVIRTALAKGAA